MIFIALFCIMTNLFKFDLEITGTNKEKYSITERTIEIKT